MLFQLFRDSCLKKTEIGWMVSSAKLLDEDCVLMFFILMTSHMMLIPNHFFRLQIIGSVCIHSFPNKDLKNCCPPSEIAVTVTHCHILNFHCTKTPLLTGVCLLLFSHCLSLYAYHKTVCTFLCILRILYYGLLLFCVRLTRVLLNATCLDHQTKSVVCAMCRKCRAVRGRVSDWMDI